MSNELSIWEDDKQIASIKGMYGSNLSVAEFQTFLQIGKHTGLNPFKREIWAVKYKGPAQIFVGRDGYRTIIGRNPNYEHHIVDAVYANDQYECDLVNGKVSHKYSLTDRGELVGAYCLVKMKSSPIPFYVFCEFKEYNQGQSLWKSKPATMIKKVAESQAIRMAIPSELNGTYTPEEMPQEYNVPPREEKKVIHEEEEYDPAEHEKLVINVRDLLDIYDVPQEIIEKWLKKGGVDNLSKLTINQLRAIKNLLENNKFSLKEVTEEEQQ